MDEMEAGHASSPLFEVALQLQEPDIVFLPSLKADDLNGFYHLIDSLLTDVIRMSVLVKRVAKYLSQANYKVSNTVLSNVSESFPDDISLCLRMKLHVLHFSYTCNLIYVLPFML
jgi:dynein heavy chain